MVASPNETNLLIISTHKQTIKDCKAGKQHRASGTILNYERVLRALQNFPKRTDFDTINQQWYNDYTGQMRENKRNENTIANHIKVIKSVLRMANELGISNNIEYTKKYFKKPSEPTDSIYLTESEMELWANVDLTNFVHLQVERDRFLISYYFLLRFGDSLILNKSNIYEENGRTFVRITHEKTKKETIVPVSPKALELLKKYDYQMPKTSNTESNWKLKDIGCEAKIESIVKVGGLERKKYHFITTHTARRSGATNLYLQGVPDKVIMDLGGWTKVETFRSYIKLSKLESANKALDYDFFK